MMRVVEEGEGLCGEKKFNCYAPTTSWVPLRQNAISPTNYTNKFTVWILFKTTRSPTSTLLSPTIISPLNSLISPWLLYCTSYGCREGKVYYKEMSIFFYFLRIFDANGPRDRVILVLSLSSKLIFPFLFPCSSLTTTTTTTCGNRPDEERYTMEIWI